MNSYDNNMEEARKIMEAFKKQTEIGSPTKRVDNIVSNGVQFDNQGGNFARPGDGNMVGMGFDNQGESNAGLHPPVINRQVNNMTNPQQIINQSGHAPVSRADICPQCKTMHPPLRPGEKCPNAGVDRSFKETTGIDDSIINKHLVDMKNIIITQISAKGIKDGKKFFQHAVIELTKALEKYSE